MYRAEWKGFEELRKKEQNASQRDVTHEDQRPLEAQREDSEEQHEDLNEGDVDDDG